MTDEVRGIYKLLDSIQKNGEYFIFSMMVGECISADSNLTEDDEAINDMRLKAILSAIEMFSEPPPQFVKRKSQIEEYLRLRATGEIGLRKMEG